MTEIIDILKSAPSPLIWRGLEFTCEEIDDLLMRGVKHKEVEHQMNEDGVNNE